MRIAQGLFATSVTTLLCLEHAAALGCTYMPDAPVMEKIIPSFGHTLKFLDVDAKVYRHTVSSGSQPKLRILRYSSPPVVDIDSDSKQIVVSTDGSPCLGGGGGSGGGDAGDAGDAGAVESSAIGRNNGWVATLAVALAASFAGAGFGPMAGSLLSILAFSHVNGVSAHESECTPTMEVVLEAPPYYVGSVDECRAEVSNPDHCPSLDFPTFQECTNTEPTCKLAVVGAGTGGLYTAMRLLDEGVFEPEEVCVFEATERVGGRLYSLRGFGPNNTITVDSGGYRTWPEFTPTTHALITDMLGLPVACYEDETPCQKYNIVDENGNKNGFATFVEEMMRRIVDQGVCYFSRHELVSMEYNEDTETKSLVFSNGVVAADVEQVILNLPQRPLLKVLRKSTLPEALNSRELSRTYDALHSVQTEIVVKCYLYYSDAWWYKLGLTNGDFSKPGDARNMLLEGRYHDGHVECDDEDQTQCHGFLLAVYTHDFGGTKSQYFRRFQRDRPEPVTILSNSDPEGAEFLRHAHDQLREYHLYENTDANYTGYEATKVFNEAGPPEFAALSTWNIGTFGAGGGWHHWTDVANVDKAMKPLNPYGVHVVNEAFSKLQGWAEGTLMLADEVLEDYFGVERPWDFPSPDYIQRVAQTSSNECVEVEEEEETSTGGGGDAGGGAGGAPAPDLCFTADAKVTMADGSLVRIADLQKGDVVSTGFSGEQGRVTEVLIHDVPEESIDVAVVPTPFGDLVGTPTHPVFVDGKWMELHEAVDLGTLDRDGVGATIDRRVVKQFYNLEVDGDKPGKSSHSYVVNGIVASGLGDNVELNTIFARQDHWKKYSSQA